jgi:hypothetical protein
MRVEWVGWCACLVLGCASTQGETAPGTQGDAGELADAAAESPVPRLPELMVDRDGLGGACGEPLDRFADYAPIALFRGREAISILRDAFELDAEALIVAVEEGLPDVFMDESSLHDLFAMTELPYRSIRFEADGATYHLALLGLRAWRIEVGTRIHIHATKSVIYWGYHRQEITIRVGDRVVLYSALEARPEDLHPPTGFSVQVEEALCVSPEICGGYASSLRMGIPGEETIVLEPRQARSLGDYDLHLWNASLDSPDIESGLLDCNRDHTQLLFVRRDWTK